MASKTKSEWAKKHKRKIILLLAGSIAVVVGYLMITLPSTIRGGEMRIQNWLNNNNAVKTSGTVCRSVELKAVFPPFLFQGFARFDTGRVYVSYNLNPFTAKYSMDVDDNSMVTVLATTAQNKSHQELKEIHDGTEQDVKAFNQGVSKNEKL